MTDWFATLMNPGILLLALLLSFLFLISRPDFWSLRSGFMLLALSTGFLFYAVQDRNFQNVLSDPDTIAAAALLFLVLFFFWAGLYQAHANDKRSSSGAPPAEAAFTEKVATWPDLLYVELISAVLMTVLLITWSLLVSAPLEEWADPTRSPNPSKAPWYFLGLQELLVYFDPWIAGVVIPLLIIFGLMAVPYIDSSVEGSGYYSFSKRKFASVAFLGGFFFWVALIIIGTFFRGQNWHFYGLFENRALVKSEALHLVNLSDIVWTQLLNVQKPDHWLAREFFGIALLLFYFAILPLLVRKSGKKRNLVTLLLLFSAAGVAIKIFLRLAFDIKYVLYLPEYVLNI